MRMGIRLALAALVGIAVGVGEYVMRKRREREETRQRLLLSPASEKRAEWERAEWMGTRDE